MFFLLACWLAISPYASLHLQLSNVQPASGQLYIAVFDSKSSFLNVEKARHKMIVPVEKTGEIELVFQGIPKGTYAISCFHDQNNNGRLDKNWLGIPTEAYCFSNNARPRFRAPSWEEARCTVAAGKTSLRLRLEKW